MEKEVLKAVVKNAVREALAVKNARPGETKKFITLLPGHDPKEGKSHKINTFLRVSGDGKIFEMVATKIAGAQYQTTEKRFPISEWDTIVSKIKSFGGKEI